MVILSPHTVPQRFQDINLVETRWSEVQTGLFSIDQAWRCSLMRSGMILTNIFVTTENTQMQVHLFHSRWVPYFGILTTNLFFYSLGQILDSQHLWMNGSGNYTRKNSVERLSRPAALLRLRALIAKIASFLFGEAIRIHTLRWLVVSFTFIRCYTIYNCVKVLFPPLQLLIVVDEKPSVSQDHWKAYDHLKALS